MSVQAAAPRVLAQPAQLLLPACAAVQPTVAALAPVQLLLCSPATGLLLRSPLPAAFLAVADEQFGRQVPFAFLEKVKEEFFAKWEDKAQGAIAHSLDKSFGPRLKYWMEYCEAHPEELSKVAAVQKKVRF